MKLIEQKRTIYRIIPIECSYCKAKNNPYTNFCYKCGGLLDKKK